MGLAKRHTIEDPDELVRPSLNVKVPEVKLRLQDLAYLRSLGNPTEIRCRPTTAVVDRLRFLDLIARANVPPNQKALAQLDAEKAGYIIKLKKAVEDERWQEAAMLCYSLRTNDSSREAKPQDVLTDKGKRILLDGEVRVRVRKVGCL